MTEGAARSLLGRRLGAYEVLSLLGAGGMGEVYRALDTALNRDIALKVLPDAFALDGDRLSRFRREARALASLNHANIVTIFSIEEKEGIPFMTMELIEGDTLAHGTPAGGVTPARFFDIAIGLADALSAAHQKHVIHRDLKPANVMVTDDGRVKVLDFGLARAIDADAVPIDEVTHTATRVGTIVGTMPYMSPEQIEGRPLDHRTDLFSLGVVLYELATGARPFRGDSSPALMSSILKDRPTPVREQRADFPADACRLIDRCLEKEPRDRIQTAAEILGELKADRRTWESGSDRATRPASHSTQQPAERAASIAVLSFTDMSAAKDQDWFCDGVAEEIINALTPLKGLRVAARTSAFSFKGKGDDLRTIGQKLSVTTVLDGSVRRAGDRVRITVQLSNVADGFQMWSERYDRELKDIFDVQDEIARAVAERLRVTLAGGRDVRLVEQATTNIEAYQLYLQGRALLGRRGVSIPLALNRFRKAVELDPAYSSAWAGLADSFTGLAITGSVSSAESKGEAMAAAKRSIALDPGSAAGHSALANATLFYENNRTQAGQEFERALELSPDYHLGRCWYGLFYLQWARGEIERGITEARRAFDHDPMNSYLAMILGCGYCTAGRLEKAVETGRLAIQLDPESFVAHWALGVSLRMNGQFEEATSILNSAAAMSNRHARALSSLAAVFGDWGRPSEAAALFGELRERSTRSFVPASYLALAAEGAGQHEEALALARQAGRDREPTFILHARHYSEFRAFRSDPRFAAILHEMDSMP